MPTISLRLTERELEQLRAWATDSKRSVQKEVIWRLFSGQPEFTEWQVAASAERLAAGRGLNYEQVRNDHFKPDFKRGQK